MYSAAEQAGKAAMARAQANYSLYSDTGSPNFDTRLGPVGVEGDPATAKPLDRMVLGQESNHARNVTSSDPGLTLSQHKCRQDDILQQDQTDLTQHELSGQSGRASLAESTALSQHAITPPTSNSRDLSQHPIQDNVNNLPRSESPSELSQHALQDISRVSDVLESGMIDDEPTLPVLHHHLKEDTLRRFQSADQNSRNKQAELSQHSVLSQDEQRQSINGPGNLTELSQYELGQSINGRGNLTELSQYELGQSINGRGNLTELSQYELGQSINGRGNLTELSQHSVLSQHEQRQSINGRGNLRELSQYELGQSINGRGNLTELSQHSVLSQHEQRQSINGRGNLTELSQYELGQSINGRGNLTELSQYELGQSIIGRGNLTELPQYESRQSVKGSGNVTLTSQHSDLSQHELGQSTNGRGNLTEVSLQNNSSQHELSQRTNNRSNLTELTQHSVLSSHELPQSINGHPNVTLSSPQSVLSQHELDQSTSGRGELSHHSEVSRHNLRQSNPSQQKPHHAESTAMSQDVTAGGTTLTNINDLTQHKIDGNVTYMSTSALSQHALGQSSRDSDDLDIRNLQSPEQRRGHLTDESNFLPQGGSLKSLNRMSFATPPLWHVPANYQKKEVSRNSFISAKSTSSYMPIQLDSQRSFLPSGKENYPEFTTIDDNTVSIASLNLQRSKVPDEHRYKSVQSPFNSGNSENSLEKAASAPALAQSVPFISVQTEAAVNEEVVSKRAAEYSKILQSELISDEDILAEASRLSSRSDSSSSQSGGKLRASIAGSNSEIDFHEGRNKTSEEDRDLNSHSNGTLRAAIEKTSDRSDDSRERTKSPTFSLSKSTAKSSTGDRSDSLQIESFEGKSNRNHSSLIELKDITAGSNASSLRFVEGHSNDPLQTSLYKSKTDESRNYSNEEISRTLPSTVSKTPAEPDVEVHSFGWQVDKADRMNTETTYSNSVASLSKSSTDPRLENHSTPLLAASFEKRNNGTLDLPPTEDFLEEKGRTQSGSLSRTSAEPDIVEHQNRLQTFDKNYNEANSIVFEEAGGTTLASLAIAATDPIMERNTAMSDDTSVWSDGSHTSLIIPASESNKNVSFHAGSAKYGSTEMVEESRDIAYLDKRTAPECSPESTMADRVAAMLKSVPLPDSDGGHSPPPMAYDTCADIMNSNRNANIRADERDDIEKIAADYKSVLRNARHEVGIISDAESKSEEESANRKPCMNFETGNSLSLLEESDDSAYVDNPSTTNATVTDRVSAILETVPLTESERGHSPPSVKMAYDTSDIDTCQSYIPAGQMDDVEKIATEYKSALRNARHEAGIISDAESKSEEECTNRNLGMYVPIANSRPLLEESEDSAYVDKPSTAEAMVTDRVTASLEMIPLAGSDGIHSLPALSTAYHTVDTVTVSNRSYEPANVTDDIEKLAKDHSTVVRDTSHTTGFISDMDSKSELESAYKRSDIRMETENYVFSQILNDRSTSGVLIDVDEDGRMRAGSFSSVTSGSDIEDTLDGDVKRILAKYGRALSSDEEGVTKSQYDIGSDSDDSTMAERVRHLLRGSDSPPVLMDPNQNSLGENRTMQDSENYTGIGDSRPDSITRNSPSSLTGSVEKSDKKQSEIQDTDKERIKDNDAADVEKEKVERQAEAQNVSKKKGKSAPKKSSRSSSRHSSSSSIDYNNLEKDLDEIASNLASMKDAESVAGSQISEPSKSNSIRSSPNITDSKSLGLESSKSLGGPQTITDYDGQHLNYVTHRERTTLSDSGRTASALDRSAKNLLDVNPLLTSGIVPFEVALDIIHGPESSTLKRISSKLYENEDLGSLVPDASNYSVSNRNVSSDNLKTRARDDDLSGKAREALLKYHYAPRDHTSNVASEQSNQNGIMVREEQRYTRDQPAYRRSTEELTADITSDRTEYKSTSRQNTFGKARRELGDANNSKVDVGKETGMASKRNSGLTDNEFRHSTTDRGQFAHSTALDTHQLDAADWTESEEDQEVGRLAPRDGDVPTFTASDVNSSFTPPADDSLSQKVQEILERGSPPRQAYQYLQEADNLERSLDAKSYEHSYVGDYSKYNSYNSPDYKSHFTPIQKEPFSAFGTMKTFFESQMDKVEMSKFDKSIELRTPYRRQLEANLRSNEGSERAYETKEDYFVEPTRNADTQRRIATENTENDPPTPKEPASSYRPQEKPEVIHIDYTTDDGTNMSVATETETVESTHPGSDDAKAPNFPTHVLGSRTDIPHDEAGIYGGKTHPSTSSTGAAATNLKTIPEQSFDSKSTESGNHSQKQSDSTEKSRKAEEKERSFRKIQNWVNGISPDSPHDTSPNTGNSTTSVQVTSSGADYDGVVKNPSHVVPPLKLSQRDHVYSSRESEISASQRSDTGHSSRKTDSLVFGTPRKIDRNTSKYLEIYRQEQARRLEESPNEQFQDIVRDRNTRASLHADYGSTSSIDVPVYRAQSNFTANPEVDLADSQDYIRNEYSRDLISKPISISPGDLGKSQNEDGFSPLLFSQGEDMSDEDFDQTDLMQEPSRAVPSRQVLTESTGKPLPARYRFSDGSVIVRSREASPDSQLMQHKLSPSRSKEGPAYLDHRENFSYTHKSNDRLDISLGRSSEIRTLERNSVKSSTPKMSTLATDGRLAEPSGRYHSRDISDLSKSDSRYISPINVHESRNETPTYTMYDDERSADRFVSVQNQMDKQYKDRSVSDSVNAERSLLKDTTFDERVYKRLSGILKTEDTAQSGLPPNLNDMWDRFLESRNSSLCDSQLELPSFSSLVQNPVQHLVQQAQKRADISSRSSAEDSRERSQLDGSPSRRSDQHLEQKRSGTSRKVTNEHRERKQRRESRKRTSREHLGQLDPDSHEKFNDTDRSKYLGRDITDGRSFQERADPKIGQMPADGDNFENTGELPSHTRIDDHSRTTTKNISDRETNPTTEVTSNGNRTREPFDDTLLNHKYPEHAQANNSISPAQKEDLNQKESDSIDKSSNHEIDQKGVNNQRRNTEQQKETSLEMGRLDILSNNEVSQSKDYSDQEKATAVNGKLSSAAQSSAASKRGIDRTAQPQSEEAFRRDIVVEDVENDALECLKESQEAIQKSRAAHNVMDATTNTSKCHDKKSVPIRKDATTSTRKFMTPTSTKNKNNEDLSSKKDVATSATKPKKKEAISRAKNASTSVGDSLLNLSVDNSPVSSVKVSKVRSGTEKQELSSEEKSVQTLSDSKPDGKNSKLDGGGLPDDGALKEKSQSKAWFITEETLLSIPEDATLESVSSDYTTSSSIESNGKVITMTTKRHLPNDPRLVKLQQKIAKQKEQYKREKVREKNRKEKIYMLEKLLHDKKRSGRSDAYATDSGSSISSYSGSKITSTPSTSETDATTLTISGLSISSTLTPIALTSEEETLMSTVQNGRQELQNVSTASSCICQCKQGVSGKTSRASPRKSKRENKEQRAPRGMSLREVDYKNLEKPVREVSRHGSSYLEYKKTETKNKARLASSMKAKQRKSPANSPKKTVKEFANFAAKRTYASMPPKPQTRRKKVVPNPKGLSWFVPVKGTKPWRSPLRERQQADIERTRGIVDAMAYGLQDSVRNSGDPEIVLSRPRSFPVTDKPDQIKGKLSIQEAFLRHKQDFISRSRERQKRVALRAEERRIQTLHERERQKLFDDNQQLDPNRNTHPLSDQHYNPQKRVMTREEMKELTKRIYDKLPEVIEAIEKKKTQESYKTNRLRAKEYKKKVLRKVLTKNKNGPWLIG